MVLFEDFEGNLLASHLPLYSQPHDYQLIYRVKVDDQQGVSALLKQSMVTLLPQPFDLQRLIDGDGLSISARFFSGHFERGGTPTLDSQISFEHPVYIRKVVNHVDENPLRFVLLPINKHQFLVVHQIHAAPSFDALGLLGIGWQPKNTTSNNFSCKKFPWHNLQSLNRGLAQCTKATWVYIETEDFKK